MVKISAFCLQSPHVYTFFGSAWMLWPVADSPEVPGSQDTKFTTHSHKAYTTNP